MKKTFLIFIATLLFSVNFALAQTSYTPADFDYTFGVNGTPFIYEPIARVAEIETNRAGELVITDGWGIKIYDANGRLLRSNGYIGPANSFVLTSFLNLRGDDIFVGGQVYVNGIWERFITKLDSNLNVVPSFGNGGSVIVPPKSINHQANAMTLQKDGKIILVGETYDNWSNFQTHSQFTTRFNQDGSIDRTFGNRGTIYESINNDYTRGTSVDIQGENIVVAGRHLNGGSHLVVYDKNGVLQRGFNNGNILIGLGDQVAVQFDHKIVVSASANTYNLSITRLNIDGTFDQSFGIYQPYGIVTHTLLWGYSVEIRRIALTNRNEIVVVGGFNEQSFIARYTARGYLDQNFITSYQQHSYMINGTNLLDFNNLGNFSTIYDVTFQGNKTVVVSNFFGNGVFGSVIARLNG
jgi:uncharacterized delta-60 repeat protein